jgi:hypothetical protein
LKDRIEIKFKAKIKKGEKIEKLKKRHHEKRE